MVILIAPIGVNTSHVKGWLREISEPVETLWLIHSKKGPKADFPRIAKQLELDLKRSYQKLEIKKKVIDNALTVDPTIDAIHKIILEEEEKDLSIIRKDFGINITGGTNIIAAASILSATFFGTKAYYIREPQKGDPRGKKYVDELPVRPIGIAKLNENQLQVLKVIAENYYEIEGGPIGFDKKRIEGSISRSKLLEKLRWNKPVRGSKISRREGNTRLLGITKKLEDADLITKIPYTEKFVNVAEKTKTVVDSHGYIKRVEDTSAKDKWVLKRNDKEVRFQVTAAGKRQARDSFMF